MLDRDPNDILDIAERFPYEHAAIAATTAIKLRTIRGPLRFNRVEYDNPTGFANNASAYWTINVLANATVVASWSTQTIGSGGNGDLPVDTFLDLVPAALDVNRVALGSLTAPIVLSVQFVKTGAPANLPIGRFFFHATGV